MKVATILALMHCLVSLAKASYMHRNLRHDEKKQHRQEARKLSKGGIFHTAVLASDAAKKTKSPKSAKKSKSSKGATPPNPCGIEEPNDCADCPIMNVTDCGRVLYVNGTLIQVPNGLDCRSVAPLSLTIYGDNNVIDCLGSTTFGNTVFHFTFYGMNNTLKNCTFDTTTYAIDVWSGASLYVSNIVSFGYLGVFPGGEVTVVDSEFTGKGVEAYGSSINSAPFKLKVVRTKISDARIGALLRGQGDACLAENDFSGNDVNVDIRQATEPNYDGIPTVTMESMNACDATSGVDIRDNTGTTAVSQVACDKAVISRDNTTEIDGYCDVSCPTASP